MSTSKSRFFFLPLRDLNSINPEICNMCPVGSTDGRISQTDSSKDRQFSHQTPSDSGCSFPESRISSVHVQISLRRSFFWFCFVLFFPWQIISQGGQGLSNVSESIYFPTLTPEAGFMFHLGSVQELISSWASLSVSVTESRLHRPGFFSSACGSFFFFPPERGFFSNGKNGAKLTLGL